MNLPVWGQQKCTKRPPMVELWFIWNEFEINLVINWLVPSIIYNRGNNSLRFWRTLLERRTDMRTMIHLCWELDEFHEENDGKLGLITAWCITRSTWFDCVVRARFEGTRPRSNCVKVARFPSKWASLSTISSLRHAN